MSSTNFTTWSRFNDLFESHEGVTQKRWLLLSKGYAVGLFNDYVSANEYKMELPMKNVDFDTTILPINMKVPSAMSMTPNWLTTGRTKCTATIKNILDEFDLLPKWCKVGYTDLMFLYIILNPELLSQHPKFYVCVKKKIVELLQAIEEDKTLPRSSVLPAMQRFLEEIKKRPDYVAEEPVVACRRCACPTCKDRYDVVQKLKQPSPAKNTHTYNLRKHNRIMF